MVSNGPVPIKHGNLYDLATCPGYWRYFISLIVRVRLGEIGALYTSKVGTGARDGRTAGTGGSKWDGGRMAGGDDEQADRYGENIFWW